MAGDSGVLVFVKNTNVRVVDFISQFASPGIFFPLGVPVGMVGIEVPACDGEAVARGVGEDILEWKIGAMLTARDRRDVDVV